MKNLISLLSLATLFTLNSAHAGCDPCKCGYGGLDPWPDELIEYCSNRRTATPPSQSQNAQCISKQSARDILAVNLKENGIQSTMAISNLRYSVRKEIYLSSFELNEKTEEVGISCLGIFESSF